MKTATFQINDLFEGKEVTIRYDGDNLYIKNESSGYSMVVNPDSQTTSWSSNRSKYGGHPQVGFGSVEVVRGPDPVMRVEGTLDPEVYGSIVALGK